MKILITGGAGFIGSHFVKFVLRQKEVQKVINLDKLTYAGNLTTLTSVDKDPKYEFIKGDIADQEVVHRIFAEGVDILVNFAAETHVDRSINQAQDFIVTDIQGVFILLEAAKKFGIKKFIQVSTDEVYGSIAVGQATESFPLMPSNPYSASKSGGDRLAYAYYKTYGLPVMVTRASNNYGAYQYPEKLIPLFITNALKGKKCPMYGDGCYDRDWLHVSDHCEAIWTILHRGVDGETYNIAGEMVLSNSTVAEMILTDLHLSPSLIESVTDRPGHDRRYAMDAGKLRQLGWTPKIAFEEGLKDTIIWYTNNEDWWVPIKNGSYKKYYLEQYGERL